MHKKLLMLMILSIVFTQEGFVGETFDRGNVNYEQRTIQATGIGFIPENVINAGQARRAAMRIAKQDALRQLIEIVNGVNVTSETTVSGAMFDDIIKTQVQGAIRGARKVGDPKYLSDASVEVTYEVAMNNISRALLPVAQEVSPPDKNRAFENEQFVDQAKAREDAVSEGATGIIIDATGLGLRPAMSPRILDQNGSILYGPGSYDRNYAVTNGVVGYTKTVTQAKKDNRVQGNPLILRGASASGTAMTDIIISNQDASKLITADRSGNLLKNCRVMFVLN